MERDCRAIHGHNNGGVALRNARWQPSRRNNLPEPLGEIVDAPIPVLNSSEQELTISIVCALCPGHVQVLWPRGEPIYAHHVHAIGFAVRLEEGPKLDQGPQAGKVGGTLKHEEVPRRRCKEREARDLINCGGRALAVEAYAVQPELGLALVVRAEGSAPTLERRPLCLSACLLVIMPSAKRFDDPRSER